ncbi:hypothetical protein Efla_002498 [Eimeria flavescens]
MEGKSKLQDEPPKPYKVAISGSHGLIGSYLMQMMKDPSCRIEGRPVLVCRLLRTSSSQGGRSTDPSPANPGCPEKGQDQQQPESPALARVTIPQDYLEEDILWAPRENWIEGDKLESVDAVIHLAGEPVAEKGEVAGSPTKLAAEGPGDESGASTLGLASKLMENEWMRALGSWNASKKAEIQGSRVRTTCLLAFALSALQKPPKSFFVASGIGVYGTAWGDVLCDEEREPGTTFVASVSKNTESAAMMVNKGSNAGAVPPRVVFLRFAPVLSLKGGVLPRMRALSDMRVGSRYGDGRQWMSWISLLDACRSILFLLDNPSIEGPVNICSPEPVRNADFCATLKEVTHPKAWFFLPLPIPASLLRFALGQLAEELLLNGQRGIPQKLLVAGFTFSHAALLPALQWCWAEGSETHQRTSSLGGNSQSARHLHTSVSRGPTDHGLAQKQLLLTRHKTAAGELLGVSFALATDAP